MPSRNQSNLVVQLNDPKDEYDEVISKIQLTTPISQSDDSLALFELPADYNNPSVPIPRSPKKEVETHILRIEDIVRTQHIIRKWIQRRKARKQLLLDTWNTLESREEAELTASHALYSDLKNVVLVDAIDKAAEALDRPETDTEIVDAHGQGVPLDQFNDFRISPQDPAFVHEEVEVKSDVTEKPDISEHSPQPETDNDLDDDFPNMSVQYETRLKQLQVLREFRETAVPLPHSRIRSRNNDSSVQYMHVTQDDDDDDDDDIFQTYNMSLPITPTNSSTLRVPQHYIDNYPRANLRILSDADPIDLMWINMCRDEFAAGKVLGARNVMFIISRLYRILCVEPNINACMVPANGKVTVVGDIHGQLQDLLSILRLNGPPSPSNIYIFNGDWVDRGQNSCECVLLILAWKLYMPGAVLLNRGNHECADINSRDGFERECYLKYGSGLFAMFSQLFATIPIASIVNKAVASSSSPSPSPSPSIFVVHGGIPYKGITIADIQSINRFYMIPPSNSLLCGLLWSDPTPHKGVYPSSRGAGVEFGPDVTYDFLKNNNLCLLVRSHECIDSGWELMHKSMLVTVFSASNYANRVGNQGAIMLIEESLRPTFVTLMARRDVLATRTSYRYRLLETDLMRKLMERIAMSRLDLIERYRKQAQDNMQLLQTNNRPNVLNTTAAIPQSHDVISRCQWAEGLRVVLGIDIPFRMFENELGLPVRGVLGDEGGPINFMTFLSQFEPKLIINRRLKNATTSLSHTMSDSEVPTLSPSSSSHSPANPAMDDVVKVLIQVIFAHRYEMESVFRFLDTNNDNIVTREEFITGVKSLVRIFKDKYRSNLGKHCDPIPTSNSNITSETHVTDPRTAESPLPASTQVNSNSTSDSASTQDGDGTWWSPSLARALDGLEYGDAELHLLADLVDINKDGRIQYTEFIECFGFNNIYSDVMSDN